MRKLLPILTIPARNTINKKNWENRKAIFFVFCNISPTILKFYYFQQVLSWNLFFFSDRKFVYYANCPFVGLLKNQNEESINKENIFPDSVWKN